MIYCSGKTKAIVKIQWSDGTTETVIADAPAEVTITPVQAYTLHWTYKPNGITDPNPQRTNNLGNLPIPVTLGQVVYSRGNLQSDVFYTDGLGLSKSLTLVNNSVYTHTVTNLHLTNGASSSQVKVIDKNGKVVYEETKLGTAKVDVTCDDECPDGHVKCTHNKYPGYCCIPCKSTAEKINNLASKVRG